jgi:endonuclease/exonuclease/phosphatase family metal-dependent hydrolase
VLVRYARGQMGALLVMIIFMIFKRFSNYIDPPQRPLPEPAASMVVALSRLDGIRTAMRLATFNIENLDAPPKAKVAVTDRAEILRPQLMRLNADILCLQEINSQRRKGGKDRSLKALELLLEGTQYENYELAASQNASDGTLADIHNLVILSRFPICSHIELKHTLVSPVEYQYVTSTPAETARRPVYFERPALVAEIALPNRRTVTVINVHLRAPLASAVPGQKLSSLSWKSAAGWAEGFFLSGLKRSAQALEIRLALDNMLDADPGRPIAVCGDFNAEEHETPVRILQAASEDTGNAQLEGRSLVVADRMVAKDRRFSVLHNGRPLMLDHILVTRSIAGHLTSVSIQNDTLTDEAAPAVAERGMLGSYHAPIVAEFEIS